MPYIDPKARQLMDDDIQMLRTWIKSPGQLNYAISKLIHLYLQEGEVNYEINYASLNEVIGVLECAKLELYRKVVSKYEDKMKWSNGPVSELDTESQKT